MGVISISLLLYKYNQPSSSVDFLSYAGSLLSSTIANASVNALDQPFNFSCLESYTIAFSMVSLPELALSIHQTSDGVIVLTSKSDVTPYSVFFNGQTNLHGISGPSWSGPVYS